MHDSCFVTKTSWGGTNLPLAQICCDCTVHCDWADSCTVSKHTHTHRHFTRCHHLPSSRPVSLNTGSSLCIHCCLCRNDLEINGLGVILCLSHKPRRNMTRALRWLFWICLLPPFQSWKAVRFFSKLSCDDLDTSDFLRDGTCSWASGHHRWSRCSPWGKRHGSEVALSKCRHKTQWRFWREWDNLCHLV